MSAVPRPLSADDYREALNADCKLAELELYDDLAALHDEETCPRMRQLYAQRFRELVGVHPDQRDEFQQALERIRDGGGVPVQDVVDGLQ